jgi:ubiquinone/menaquinone biosynthesis C-methylase UbiE
MAATSGLGAWTEASAWDKNAANYSQIQVVSIPVGVKALQMVGLSPGEKLLDVATGPGNLALYAAREKQASVHAIDFGPALIAGLQAELQANPADVTARVMDGQALQYPDATFDVTCSIYGVFLFADYQQGLREMARVTRPGGRVVVAAPADEGRSVVQGWKRLAELEFPEAMPMPPCVGWDAMQSRDSMFAALEAAGFTDVAAEEYTTWRDIPDAKEHVASMMQHPWVLEIQKRLSKERAAELAPAMVRLLETEYVDQDGKCGYECTNIIGTAKKP